MNEKIEASVQDVSPPTAETWLGKNERNRNIRQRVVAAYARDMAAGNWHLSGEAIKFARSGRLLDGQHRLHAVIQSGVTVKMLIVRGLAEQIQDVIDAGASRTAGDAFRMRGETSYSALAATARLAILHSGGLSIDAAGAMRPTHSEILAFVDENPDLKTAVDMSHGYRRGIDAPASVVALACWILSRVDPDDTERFMTTLATKTDLRAGDAILALLNRLTEVRRNGRVVTRSDYLSLIFRSWNYWRSRTKVNALPLRDRGGPVAVPDPK